MNNIDSTIVLGFYFKTQWEIKLGKFYKNIGVFILRHSKELNDRYFTRVSDFLA